MSITIGLQPGLPAFPRVSAQIYYGEHNIVCMLTSRQAISFSRSGHLFVACEPQQRHDIRRSARTHLPLGLVSFYVASPCAWFIGLGFVASAGDSQDEI